MNIMLAVRVLLIPAQLRLISIRKKIFQLDIYDHEVADLLVIYNIYKVPKYLPSLPLSK